MTVEAENTLAKRINTAGENARYDNFCKNLLANKQILAWILKTCVSEFCDCSIEDIKEKYIEGTPQISEVTVHQDEVAEFIHGENSEDTTMNEGTITYDIRFWAVSPKDGNRIRMLINVESQGDFYPGYPIIKRGIYYCGRMLSSQYETEFTNSHYEKLKKVYSIWICTSPPDCRKNTITKYSMKEENVVGAVTERPEDFDLLTVLMVCPGGRDSENYSGLLKMLDILLSGQIKPNEKKSILQNEFNITMTKKMEAEAMKMYSHEQGVVDRTLVNAIISMMKNSDMTEEQCMALLDIPKEQRESYHLMIEDKTAVSLV